MKKMCPECGKTFEIMPRPGTRPQFCSGACRQRAYRTRKRLQERYTEVQERVIAAKESGKPIDTVAEQLDAIRAQIREEERTKFEEKLSVLDAKREKEKAHEIAKIKEKYNAEGEKLNDRYQQWRDEFDRVKRELVRLQEAHVIECHRRRKAESALENEQKNQRLQSPPAHLNREQKRAWIRAQKNSI